MPELGGALNQMMGAATMTDDSTFAELRQNAQELNAAYVLDGQPPPIPNYAQLRKSELSDRIAHCHADIDAEISEFQLDYSRLQSGVKND
jgi:hypothetical protein